MRIALTSVEIAPTARSANLARVLRCINRVAESDPAPDVLLLPAGCDGTPADPPSRAMAQTFAESLAAAAREWGVFVAAGLHERVEQSARPVACLWDPDGDVVARTPEPTGCDVARTDLGAVAVGLVRGECGPATVPDGVDVLLLAGDRNGRIPPQVTSLAERRRVDTFVVFPEPADGGRRPGGPGLLIPGSADRPAKLVTAGPLAFVYEVNPRTVRQTAGN